MDDLDCDSTWEEDEDAEDGLAGDADAGDEDAGDAEADGLRAAQAGALQSRVTGSRNWRAVQDMRRYRHHYPDLEEGDGNGDMSNLSFYRNDIPFQPNGCVIENILQQWKDNYDILEDNHSYIQWLFPLREPGVNWHAKPLTLKEVQAFKSSKEVRERLIRAYELMLGFYGIQLEDRGTGAVRRAHNYQQRFQNLNCRSHNNLRITRILKSLGELGLEHFQAPLVRFFLEETLVRQQLPAVRQSALDYFLFAVRCRRQRRELVHFAWEHFRPRCKFVWGPHDKLRRFSPRSPAPAGGGPRAGRGRRPGSDPRPERDTRGDRDPAEGPPPAPAEPPDAGTPEGGREEGGEPLSPKENKKRKLEAHRPEQAPREPGPQSAPDVENIVLNLEGCALSPGGQAPREPREAAPPGPARPGALCGPGSEEAEEGGERPSGGRRWGRGPPSVAAPMSLPGPRPRREPPRAQRAGMGAGGGEPGKPRGARAQGPREPAREAGPRGPQEAPGGSPRRQPGWALPRAQRAVGWAPLPRARAREPRGAASLPGGAGLFLVVLQQPPEG
ncbi:LOW QUALITY PROTEIN: opioid growth factor receptor [Perognathus longimembris pacificus]|uniref:LOW QUALITY PROTEIN: opioid growth factor receptor n=1 Tax=Perognathus longimembris pacificus TaxID=214514 RepID=UPI002019C4FA|nr:LOW QUALITY PROTEIN: opioid growth factor receptor [Perognathus longimembris pacificus]